MPQRSGSSLGLFWPVAAVAAMMIPSTSVAQSSSISPSVLVEPRSNAPEPVTTDKWAIEQLAKPVREPPSIVEVFGCPDAELSSDRATLTGNRGRWRTDLEESGINFDLSTTQFYQGVAHGGLQRSFQYGGRNDYFLYFDGEKLGLWQGSRLTLHGETRYGNSANFITGALSPVNEMLIVPAESGGVTALTGVVFTQQLSTNVQIYAGKVNLFDAIEQPLTGAGPLTGFQNTSLIFNTIYARTLPYSTYGAGIVYLQDDEPVASLSVYDTNDTPTTTGFPTFFNNGAVIFGLVNLPTRLFGMPGHQGVSAAYSTGRYTNIQRSSYLDPLDGLVFALPPKTGSWVTAYTFDQAFWVSSCDPNRVAGVFGNLGIADNNPNPIRWFANVGIAGASPIASREQDTFGVGYYYLGISERLKENARPATPLRNEQGVELYYTTRITPWCQITPNIQFIVPIEREVKQVHLFGLRAKVDF